MNLSKIKKIRPLYNKVLITADRFTEDQVSDSGIIDPTKQHGVLMPVQKVVAIGPMVRDVKEGDVVCFNPTRYGKTVQVKDENSLKVSLKLITLRFDIISLLSISMELIFSIYMTVILTT